MCVTNVTFMNLSILGYVSKCIYFFLCSIIKYCEVEVLHVNERKIGLVFCGKLFLGHKNIFVGDQHIVAVGYVTCWLCYTLFSVD